MRWFSSAVAAIVMIVSFTSFLALHAIHQRVATESYFTNVLATSDVYRRLYDDLLADPEFAPELDELLGGVDVKRADLVATVKQLIPASYLEATAKQVIAHIVVHFDGDAELDLSFDITPIVAGIHDVSLQALSRGLAALPVKRADSYEAFLGELEKVVGALHGEGAIPDAIPSFPIPPEHRAEVAAVIVEAGGDPAQVERAIAHDDVAGAIRGAAGALLERLIATSIDRLTHNEYVKQVGPRLMFGPGPVISTKIARDVAVIRRLNRAASTGQVVAAIAFVLAFCALLLLHRRDFAWLGGALVASGAVAFVTWWFARGVAQRDLVSAASSKSLPAAFREILGDVMHNAVADFTPSFWIPAAVCAVLGCVLIACRSSN
jgi:hypothetical protein